MLNRLILLTAILAAFICGNTMAMVLAPSKPVPTRINVPVYLPLKHSSKHYKQQEDRIAAVIDLNLLRHK